jgi:hypothetical protein
LTEEEGRKHLEKKAEAEKKAELEHTRVGVAVNTERRDSIDRPLEADWISEGPDALAAAEILGLLQAVFGLKEGGAEPSRKGMSLKEQEIRNRQR